MAGTAAFDELRFLKGFLADPLGVASPFPSGRKLARAVAAAIDPMHLEPVLELGPGTGAVTRAILERGVPESHVVGIERDSDFAQSLKRLFPRMRVLEGDAFRFDEVLAKAEIDGLFSAIVSGLPVLTQPMADRRAFLFAALSRLKPGCPFVQLSYSWRPPIGPGRFATATRASGAGIPPVHVWVYRASDQRNGQ